MSKLSKTRVEFGQFLKRARESAGVTQADLAYSLGYIVPQFVSNVERGTCRFPEAKMKKWAAKIGLPLDVIINHYMSLEREKLESAFKGRS